MSSCDTATAAVACVQQEKWTDGRRSFRDRGRAAADRLGDAPNLACRVAQCKRGVGRKNASAWALHQKLAALLRQRCRRCAEKRQRRPLGRRHLLCGNG